MSKPQSFSNLLVHIVFSTKDWFPYLSPTIQEELYPYMAQICKELKSPVKIINGTEDHVHLLCSLARTESVSRLVGIVKQHSSKWIKSKGKEWVKFQWQEGYGAFTIGISNQASLIRYIQNQKNHHRKISFKEEYIKWLNLYEIPFDERYVWD